MTRPTVQNLNTKVKGLETRMEKILGMVVKIAERLEIGDTSELGKKEEKTAQNENTENTDQSTEENMETFPETEQEKDEETENPKKTHEIPQNLEAEKEIEEGWGTCENSDTETRESWSVANSAWEKVRTNENSDFRFWNSAPQNNSIIALNANSKFRENLQNTVENLELTKILSRGPIMNNRFFELYDLPEFETILKRTNIIRNAFIEKSSVENQDVFRIVYTSNDDNVAELDGNIILMSQCKLSENSTNIVFPEYILNCNGVDSKIMIGFESLGAIVSATMFKFSMLRSRLDPNLYQKITGKPLHLSARLRVVNSPWACRAKYALLVNLHLDAAFKSFSFNESSQLHGRNNYSSLGFSLEKR